MFDSANASEEQHHTSEENKTVNTNFLISSNAQFVDQLWFSRKRCDGRQEPTISIDALFDIVGRGSINEELRVVIDIFHALHATNALERLDTIWLFWVVEGCEGVRARKIKEAIVVFLV